MSDNDTEQNTEDTFHHAVGSRVVHNDRECYHLDNANEVEELDEEEAETYRTCRQCWYDSLSYSEKIERKRKQKRSRRTRTVTVRYRQ